MTIDILDAIDITDNKPPFEVKSDPTFEELNSLPFAEDQVAVAFVLRKFFSEKFADFLTHQISSADFIYKKYIKEKYPSDH